MDAECGLPAVFGAVALSSPRHAYGQLSPSCPTPDVSRGCAMPARGTGRRGCEFPGCTRPHEGHGLCQGHLRQRKLGKEMSPLKVRARKEVAQCSFAGCQNAVASRGLCSGHARQRDRGAELHPLGQSPRRVPSVCSGPDCDRFAVAKGLCNTHYGQSRKGKELTPLIAKRVGCLAPNCERKHHGRGYCATHLYRIEKGLPLEPVVLRERKSCRFEDCTNVVSAHGLCSGHYQQQRRGVPLTPLHRPRNQTRPCSFEGCDRTALQADLCAGHLGQRSAGIPLRPLRGTQQWIEYRFAEAAAESNDMGCWLWPTTNGNGYPSCNIRFEGEKFTLAHRLAFRMFVDELPPGVAVHHTCAVKNCVNPEHLQSADTAANTLESLSRTSLVARIRHLQAQLEAGTTQ